MQKTSPEDITPLGNNKTLTTIRTYQHKADSTTSKTNKQDLETNHTGRHEVVAGTNFVNKDHSTTSLNNSAPGLLDSLLQLLLQHSALS